MSRLLEAGGRHQGDDDDDDDNDDDDNDDDNTKVREACESSTHVSDPLGAMPVTNRVTGATYKNYHCAICNGDTGVSLETSLGSDEVSPETSEARQQLSSLQFWTPRLECPTLEVSIGQ